MLGKSFLGVLVGSAALACVGARGSADPAPPVETYYVIGIAPPSAKVEVSTGEVQDGKFHQVRSFSTWNNTHWGEPEDGYLLVKVEGAPTLAVIMAQTHGGLFPGPMYSPCEKAGTGGGLMGALLAPSHPPHDAMVFAPPAGKVTYIGSMSFTEEPADKPTDGKHQLMPHYRNDIDGARAFLKAHHSEFADRLEQGSYALIPAAGHCF